MEPYEPLEMEIVEFEAEDIITTSIPDDNNGGGATNSYPIYPIGREEQGGRYTC